MALPRKSSFLPTIKSSSPSEEAEFISIRFSASSYNGHNRTTPPLETLSENTYMHREQLTPVSQQSPSRHGTPVNPDSGKRLGGAQEHLRSRNVSEGSWKAPTTASPTSRRPGGYGGFGDSMPNAPDKQHKGANLMDRLNHTIPGPFDPTGRAPAAGHAYPQRNDSLHYYTPPPPPPLKDNLAGFRVPRSVDNGHQASLSSSDAYLKPPPSTRPSHTHRAPSASGSLTDRSRNKRSRSRGPASSRKPPPRTDLLAEHHSKHTACVDLAAEFGVNNPYHSSNSSVSSGYSDCSVVSSSTAQTSPTRSQTHRRDLCQTVKDTRANGNQNKPGDLRMDATDAKSHQFAPHSVGPPQGAPPRDICVDRNPPSSGNGHQAPSYRGEHSSSPLCDVGGEDRRLQTQHARTDSRSPIPQHIGEYHDTRGISPLPSRGDCKACGIAITGKSISSADGRLTGKYHKACFVCSTCRAPFSSSVFYVLGNKPYCEQDYHKLNNSLCGSCKRGIEGQFAEDEAEVKYHLRCFRCLDCGVSLVGGYFEVSGYAYCERDAWRRVKAAQAGVGVGEKEARRPGGAGGPGQPPRGRTMPRPLPHSGPGGKQLPPPNGHLRDRGDRRLAAPPGGADQRFRMNKRMTRLGNINLNL
ncbi:hypothetical protein E4U58_004801 [Claviceps cyperi]|nr:hypothetical protein E4U58_004801 [Claviceps cyperi]